MIEIVLNEREWIEAALSNLDLGKRPMETINRYARYLYSLGYSGDEIEKQIEEFLLRCDSDVSLVKWQDAIHSAAKKADKFLLVEIDGVSITENEMQVINSINGKMARKLLFTLVCLAKYRNSINPANNNWVNYKSRDIFALANVTLSSKRQALMLNDLWQQNMIGYSKVVDNVNINVKVVDYSSPQVMYITDFRNLGNQYLLHIGEKYFACSECGLVERRVSNNQMFCKECASIINIKKTSKHYHENIA